MIQTPDPSRVAAEFALPQAVERIEDLNRGLINQTFLLYGGDNAPIAVLQRINPRVFTEPQRQMKNLRVVIDHVRHSPHHGLRLPQLFSTRDGHDWLIDQDGACWRALEFIDRARVLETAANPAQATAIGRALGQFHVMTNDLKCSALTDTLRNFHVTPYYLDRFDQTCATASEATTGPLTDLLKFIDDRRNRVSVLEDAKAKEILHRRLVHGDPKIDNFLLDQHADRVVALVDLDTINCGLVQYDIGDCLRSVCNPAGESPTEVRLARFDLPFCESALNAYLHVSGDFFTQDDYELLYPAIELIPFELGLRFLTDHLAGDQYFKTQWRGQNLHRARVQFHLVAEIENSRKQIESIIRKSRDRQTAR